MHYIALVHKDENSAYGMSFPDLPGCFSAADQHEDIISNSIEALELYLEGRDEIPAASEISDITSIAKIKEELASGAYLLSVPYVHNTGKKERINITMDKGLLQAVDETAKQRGLNRSAFIGQAVNREITRS